MSDTTQAPVISNFRNLFDSIWGADEATQPPGCPFKLRVALAGYRVTPRHPFFEFILDFGSPHIEGLLRHRPFSELGIRDGAVLTFYLPERWMSVHEQKMFIPRLQSHPEAHRIERVDICTQNALIVGGLHKESLRMFSFPGDEDDLERPGVGLLDREMH